MEKVFLTKGREYIEYGPIEDEAGMEIISNHGKGHNVCDKEGCGTTYAQYSPILSG